MIDEAAAVDPENDDPRRLPELSGNPKQELASILDEEEAIHEREEAHAVQKLRAYMAANMNSPAPPGHRPYENLLILGESGIGLSEVIKQIANELGIEIAYFNAQLIDPFLHLIRSGLWMNPDGIAARDPVTRELLFNADGSHMSVKIYTLQFVRQHNLDKASLIFFDEINRVPREYVDILNDLCSSRSINGVPTPNLRTFWGAMNPKSEGVEGLDPGWQTRFGKRVRFPGRSC